MSSHGGNALADSVDQTKLLKCTGEVVLAAWIKAWAKLYADGNCYAKKPIECEACCVDPYGMYYYEGCKQEDCEKDCEDSVNQFAVAQAKVVITSEVKKNTADCTLQANGMWDDTMKAYRNVRS